MDLAKSLGVALVQILEPRQTGRYAGKEVLLDNDKIHLLEKVYMDYNTMKPHPQ